MRWPRPASRSTTSPSTASRSAPRRPNEGWFLDGFSNVSAQETEEFLNAYFVDNRQYVGRDKTLNHIYNFAGLENKPNWVDFIKYQPGALITYWDTSYFDNNVGDHPGEGELLPVDAHPEFQHTSDGALLRPKLLSTDSTFSTQSTPAQKLHYLGEPITLDRQPAVSVFDDTQDWWFDERRARCWGPPGPLPARLVQRERPEDRHHDHRGEGQQQDRRDDGQGRPQLTRST